MVIANSAQAITVRPAGPIPVPKEIVAPSAYWLQDEDRTWAPFPYRLEEDAISWGPLWRFRRFPVASRVYLHELRRLDLEDPGQLLNFCNQFGALGVQADPGISIALDEVRHSAALLRTLTSIYHLHQAGRLDRAGIDEWHWDSEWVAPPVDAVEGRVFFTSEMNRLLVSVIPSVGFGNNKQSPHTLLDILVMQLFNDIAAGIAYKTCANDTCRGLFVHQIDRTADRHFRSKGTRYCSPRCARAQAQRNYRRRNGNGVPSKQSG
jgi:hypothetical protein